MTPPSNEDRAKHAFLASTTASSITEQRLRARLRAREGKRQPGWWLVGGVAAAALAALWFVRPTEPQTVSLAEMPEHVQVQFEGEGSIGGTPESPRLAWQDGTAHVEVEPNQGVTFTVTTEEAEVRVIGTAFDVHREHFATEVVVDHGRVAVACTGQPERIITDGERIECLPGDLPTLLRRVAALTQATSPADERLATLDHAVPMASPGSSAHGELLAHRVQALQDLQRPAEALDAAATYVGEGHAARRSDLLSFLVHGRFETARCDALDLLEQAADELPPGPEWLLLASCLTDSDPTRARRLVDAVPSSGDGGPWSALAQQLRDVLPEVSDP